MISPRAPGDAPAVFMYLNALPRETGSGAQLRFYSNVRAYCDLGFRVTLVLVNQRPAHGPVPDALPIEGVRSAAVMSRDAGITGRLAYRLALPTSSAFRYFFEAFDTLLTTAQVLQQQHPRALHHFEGEDMACGIPFLRSRNCVWSYHDRMSTVADATARIDTELWNRPRSAAERRHLRFAERAERRMALGAPLILTISDVDRKRLAAQGHRAVHTLPLSISRDSDPRVRRCGGDGPALALLHLGRTAHLPTYRSLEFLLERVFPVLPERVLERIRLRVAGSADGADPRSQRIRDLASRYPQQVTLAGFVEDLEELYVTADLQVVASTEATGLRTRIIESFAKGLPVLSTTTAADGILGLEPGSNILIADTPEAFAAALADLVDHRAKLHEVSARAYDHYLARYSRPVVAACLRHYLAECLGARL
jgi:glycosyltransferase involved in cell wall biosynthesis